LAKNGIKAATSLLVATCINPPDLANARAAVNRLQEISLEANQIVKTIVVCRQQGKISLQQARVQIISVRKTIAYRYRSHLRARMDKYKGVRFVSKSFTLLSHSQTRRINKENLPWQMPSGSSKASPTVSRGRNCGAGTPGALVGLIAGAIV
jgi:hypothetical protein